MAINNPRTQPVLSHAKGIKQIIKRLHFHEDLPADGRVMESRVDAEVDASGKVLVVEEEHIHRAECGCYLQGPIFPAGRCRAGLFVCSEHWARCPRVDRKDEDPNPLRTCAWRCWFIVSCRRLLRWLFTPPITGYRE